MNTQNAMETVATAEPTMRSPRTRQFARISAITGLVGGTAVISSGCTLGDVSAIMSILRLLGIL